MAEGIEIRTDARKLILTVTGKRPDHQPYIWIGTKDDGYLDSIDEDGMDLLRDAIAEALRDDCD